MTSVHREISAINDRADRAYYDGVAQCWQFCTTCNIWIEVYNVESHNERSSLHQACLQASVGESIPSASLVQVPNHYLTTTTTSQTDSVSVSNSENTPSENSPSENIASEGGHGSSRSPFESDLSISTGRSSHSASNHSLQYADEEMLDVVDGQIETKEPDICEDWFPGRDDTPHFNVLTWPIGEVATNPISYHITMIASYSLACFLILMISVIFCPQVLLTPYPLVQEDRSEVFDYALAKDEDYNRWRIIGVNSDTEMVTIYPIDVFGSYDLALSGRSNYISTMVVSLEDVDKHCYFLGHRDVIKNLPVDEHCPFCHAIVTPGTERLCDGNFPVGLGSKFKCYYQTACEDCVVSEGNERRLRYWLCERCSDVASLNHLDMWSEGVIPPARVQGQLEPGTPVMCSVNQLYDFNDLFIQLTVL